MHYQWHCLQENWKMHEHAQPTIRLAVTTRSLVRIGLVVGIWMALTDPLMGHEHGLSEA
jgi:hypothetical protein